MYLICLSDSANIIKKYFFIKFQIFCYFLRMILELVEKHKELAKDKPHVLTAWLSLIAFDDISKFAKLTNIAPEKLIQSLMYRLRDFQEYFRQTDPKHTEPILRVGDKQITEQSY